MPLHSLQQQWEDLQSFCLEYALHIRRLDRYVPCDASLIYHSFLCFCVRGLIYSLTTDRRTNKLPTVLLNMIQVNGVTGVRVTISGGINAPAAKL